MTFPMPLFARMAAMALLGLLAACGEPADKTTASSSPPYRVVNAVDASASCEKDEQVLSAYCFNDAGNSISASGPALRLDKDGIIVATCLTGGKNLRLFCVKP